MKMRLHKRLSRQLRQKLRNRVLSNFGRAILANSWNGELLVEAGDFNVGRRLLMDGSYDRLEIEWLIRCLGRESPAVIVAGAHVGAVLIPLAKAAGRIVGFEADATNFGLLSRNLILNHIENALVHNVAVSAADGRAVFARNSINTGNSSIATGASPAGVEVPMVRLDTALSALDGDIDLLLMDIEGHEPQALAGGSHTLARTQRLYIEFAPEHLHQHGNDPAALLFALAADFPLLYLLENGIVHEYPAIQGCKQLLAASTRRGFLRNLLFSRSPLPDDARA